MPTMSAHGNPLVADNPVLALAATPHDDSAPRSAGSPQPSGCAFLYTGHDDGNVKCWRPPSGQTAASHQRQRYTLMWSVAHPGPVTALALHGSDHLVSASTCRFDTRKSNQILFPENGSSLHLAPTQLLRAFWDL